jgi:hypothetical protein
MPLCPPSKKLIELILKNHPKKRKKEKKTPDSDAKLQKTLRKK